MHTLLVRCPQCTKLYSVDRAEIRIEKPQFQCVDCQCRFWFPFPPPEAEGQEVKSYLVGQEPPAPIRPQSPLAPEPDTNKSLPQEPMFECPSCLAPNAKGSAECKKCGLVFSKQRQKAAGVPTESIGGNAEVKAMWDKIKSDYGNIELHENFIKTAVALNQLPFASQQYRIILNANPNDDVALKMRDKIINIATLTFVPPRRNTAPSGKRFHFPLILAFVGLIMIVTGMALPPLRSVAPVGAMLAIIGFGIRIILQRS